MARRVRLVGPLLLVALTIAAAVLHGGDRSGSRTVAAGCAHRSQAPDDTERDASRSPQGAAESQEAEREVAERRARSAGRQGGPSSLFGGGPATVEPPCGDRPGLPETYADLALANSARASRDVAPGTAIKPGAYRSALREKRALPATTGSWAPYGRTPLETGRTEYDTTSGSTSAGLGNVSGRVNVLVTGAEPGTLFAGPTEGGVFRSTDAGATWTSIGDTLATQAVSGLAWTAAGGGTLLALTGDNSFGGGTSSGLGAYYTTDMGATWRHASGIPDGLLAFRLAVDPSDPNKVYAATGGGLFRSTDGGHSYLNTNLPTGTGHTPDCSGKPSSTKDCFLANMVTDVVVQGPANAQSSGGKPGAVLAAVGWRAGMKPNADGTLQSPGNGLYRSDTGAPGTFTNADFAGNAVPKTDPLTQARIGRIAFGWGNRRVAGPPDRLRGRPGRREVQRRCGRPRRQRERQHVRRAERLLERCLGLDGLRLDLEATGGLDHDRQRHDQRVGAGAPGVQGAGGRRLLPGHPGLVQPPRRARPDAPDSSGVPTRLVFGLEEVWQMTNRSTGLDGRAPGQGHRHRPVLRR